MAPPEQQPRPSATCVGERIAFVGFILYVCFAPHSVAGAEIGLSLAILGWLVRLVWKRRTGLSRTPLDLPILLFFGWTILSAIFSEEPRLSLLKLQSASLFIVFYLTQSFIKRSTAMPLVLILIGTGLVGVGASLFDVARGRGVVVESIASDSPFQAKPVGVGDALWRVGNMRVYAVAEIDEAIRRAPTGKILSASIISQGEHSEWPGFAVTDEMKTKPSPSGLMGSRPIHFFRASGWTRHYDTFSQTLQMTAQLALGLALANLQNRRRRWLGSAAFIAYILIDIGIVLTAMRTTLVALAIGSGVIAWRAAAGRARLIVSITIVAVLALGVLVVWRTRADQALRLGDASATLRWQVARVALLRVPLHPVFGHGMDAVKKRWTEWGFPGSDMIHTHSTPLQIAFERGLPALLLWLWMMWAAWRMTTRAEREARASLDRNRHGVLLGATGALAGLFASSLVNYNFGDAEVVLLFWWMMGVVVALSKVNDQVDAFDESQRLDARKD